MDASITVVCLYRVRSGQEEAFADLLRRHWPALHELELVNDTPPRHFRGAEQDGGALFVEIFEWADEDAAGRAHSHPDVMAVWEPMGALTEPRDGRPAMEFPHVRPVDLLGAS